MGGITSNCCVKEKDTANFDFSKDNSQETKEFTVCKSVKNTFTEHIIEKSKDPKRNQETLNNNQIYKLKSIKTHDEIIEEKLSKIYAIYLGYKFRKNFERIIKVDLKKQTTENTKQILKVFESTAVKNAEANRKKQFDKDGWKKYYSENDDILNINFGKVYSTKIFSEKNNEFYFGTVNIKNQKHGFGTLLTKEGTKYTGYWFENNKTGWGELIDKDANIFQGLFVNNFLTGRGEKFSNNGNYYEGEFLNSLKHGEGFEETKDHKYSGSFCNDKRHFYGKLNYKSNKDFYEGEFKDNEIIGKGKYFWSNNDYYEGTFLNGKMHGEGFYKWPDGGEYKGEYVDNLKHGFGKFKWANGRSFVGPFINGKPHGIGFISYPNNRMKDVEFENGKMKNLNLKNINTVEQIQYS